ncbi:membrane protein insertion efficiency factor YidD [candidate division WOR-1 bacterium RIFOXYA2_FULL_36_21]|uniref:Putative membrane protein insertion efficiency factor n=1 Tax=candidate division WOR-1 bacterium RIFOXYB2_FULL_36_35 TaxID=1802578 RepID=A0A1F4S6Z9_UNCSA|nr:MAG: membrane protein insertion efficiency factor YidD [candidate division WOR-1 bacterium RIFOXYA2_FULL_36_21]OGC16190.1 MAG: membrane protein insertion efficiency factor YidD [candidate division WOR-1 bacterium RIFOXYB2_FULL_36_35]OGC16911.1 MAG: membrane protein insertion efficiency factor YidD [candidate division WOR-1 bacterium RIFOXYA12_FULL_36_13]
MRFILFFIALYRKISIFKPQACRYYPTCSQYAYEAVQQYGAKGVFIALMRILRCNPFFRGGFDPLK